MLIFSMIISAPTIHIQLSVVGRLTAPAHILSLNSSRVNSEVYANNTIELTINSAYPVPITLDGVIQGSDVSVFELNPGRHTFSVPETVQIRTGTRLKFENWSDGVTASNRTEYLSRDATFTAMYVLQYSLILVSPEVNVTGIGWYNAGTSAALFAPASAPMGGILGLIGARWIFQGWYEEGVFVSSSNQFSASMTKPHRYHAIWTADYTVAGIVSGIGFIVIFLGSYFYRRRIARVTSAHTSSFSHANNRDSRGGRPE